MFVELPKRPPKIVIFMGYMGPKMLHYARQFADFNKGSHFDLFRLQLHVQQFYYGCLMCAISVQKYSKSVHTSNSRRKIVFGTIVEYPATHTVRTQSRSSVTFSRSICSSSRGYKRTV